MHLRLYDYWRSSASFRVRIALNLLGIGYESVSVNLGQSVKKGQLLARLDSAESRQVQAETESLQARVSRLLKQAKALGVFDAVKYNFIGLGEAGHG